MPDRYLYPPRRPDRCRLDILCRGGCRAFASAGDPVSALLSELAITLHTALARFARMAKPLLVLVNGPVARAGLSVAVDDAQLMDDGRIAAAQLSSSAVAALGVTRALLQDSFASGYEAQLEREARAISTAGASKECREGLAAFFAKRPPISKEHDHG